MLAARVVLWETRNMEPSPMLEEVWRIKDGWAREAGGDFHRLCQSPRQWVPDHSHPGPIVHGGKEHRRLADEVGGLRFGKAVLLELWTLAR